MCQTVENFGNEHDIGSVLEWPQTLRSSETPYKCTTDVNIPRQMTEDAHAPEPSGITQQGVEFVILLTQNLLNGLIS